MLASVFSGLQAVSVEYGLKNGPETDETSPMLAAAIITIIIAGATVMQLG
ncbi:hypothetical protein [Halostagnicola sp. A-GB9-2]|nr:hypothetical protein [Halostagnicola sp. A-GB9-2]MDJ1433200.1 hypothetical protein [Halostagnicola sp. A-GB9-2]